MGRIEDLHPEWVEEPDELTDEERRECAEIFRMVAAQRRGEQQRAEQQHTDEQRAEKLDGSDPPADT